MAAVLFLVYGAYKDVKTREIPDTLWLAMGASGVVLRMWDHQWMMMVISVGIALLFGLILAGSGLFGGADVKALLGLGFMVPFYSGFPLVISVFNNVVVIRVVELLTVFSYNSVKGHTFTGDIPVWKKTLLYMTGIPREKEALDYRFLPLQDTEGNLHLIPDVDVDMAQFKEKCTLEEIWVTYGSPLILYILIGCVMTFVWGDLVLRFLGLYM